MSNIQIPMTAQIPSGFGMLADLPTSASATAAHCGTALSGAGLGMVGGMATATVDAAPVYVARERVVTGDADRVAIRKPFPGPTTWSPPPS